MKPTNAGGHSERCRRPLDGLEKNPLTSATSTVTPARVARAKPIGRRFVPAARSALPKISRVRIPVPVRKRQ